MNVFILFLLTLANLGSEAATTQKPRGVIGSCGGEFEGQTGLIASPNYPRGQYPINATCDYVITVPDNKVVKFEFLYVDMEDGPKQKLSGCWADYIVITDENNIEAEMVGEQRFCGHDTSFNPVFSKTNKAYVWFRSDDTIQMQGFVLRWRAVDSPTEIFNCDFESKHGYCRGWRQLEPNNRVRWKVHRGQTRSSRRMWITGPAFDHTKRNIAGSYIYAEATGMKRGEVTAIISPPADIVKTERYCLTFWYHMYGSGTGTLAVYEVNEDAGKSGPPRRGNNIFLEVGDKGKSWQEGMVTLNRRALSTRIIFEVTRGMSYKGDIALDDIKISEDGCPKPK